MIECVFIISLFFIFYSYFGYALILAVIAHLRGKPVQKGNITPRVSFIIAAYNEEKRIREKIDNTLQQSYPREKLEVIVASDCSDDGTDEIVRSYAPMGVRLVRASSRKGKENAQKVAVEAASGDILVFSDVATILKPDGIPSIVRNFSDPSVGCVSSVDRFIDTDGTVSGEGAYVRYEMFLRDLETRANTLVGLSGSFFAARKEVCRDWAVDLQSDFNTLLNSVKLGMRGVSDQESVGYYKNIADEKKEFDRKVRTVLRGITVFMKSLPLLNPFRYGMFSWQLFSHKLCRWLVPFALIISILTNIYLSMRSEFYSYLLGLQGIFYSLAIAAIWAKSLTKGLLKIPYFFIMVNVSILSAWYLYFRGERMVKWEPSKR